MSKTPISSKPERASRQLTTSAATGKRVRPTYRWIMLVCLVAVAISLWLLFSLLLGRYQHSKSIGPQVDRYPAAMVYRKGNLNGTPLAIRGDYLEFPVTYLDKDPWTAASSPDYYQKKTYVDGIADFAVLVRWPSMEPHKPSNDPSWKLYGQSRATEWIGIAAVGDLKAEARPPYKTDNGLARSIAGRIEGVVKFPSQRVEHDGRVTTMDLHYVLHGLDPALGLQVAKTAGRDADRPGGGNADLYWRGDLQHVVETSISCSRGTRPNPDLAHTCTHAFEMLELGAYVSVYYTVNLLPQWQQIETRAREFILSLRVDPKTTSIR